MRMIAVILSLGLLMSIEGACAQNTRSKTYSVSVSVHSGLPKLTEDQIKEILANASKMLQKPGHVDQPGNVACKITFALKGPVRNFSSPPAKVRMRDLDAVHRIDSDVSDVDFHVQVVEKINEYCRFPDSTISSTNPDGLGFAGCSFPPNFRSIIVTHPATHTDPRNPSQNLAAGTFPDHVLWAHEFGHLTGLGHRGGTDQNALMTACPLNVQFPANAVEEVQVSQQDCDCLMSGPGFGQNGSCPLGVPTQAPVCGHPH
jgi:hypothetical protein